MALLIEAPYGTWVSPITAAMTASADTLGRSTDIVVDGETLYWVEMRPSERGRNVIMRHTHDGKVVEITPKEFDVRCRVHEYGGLAFTVNEGIVYFVNRLDQRLYVQSPADHMVPKPLTDPGRRYGELLWTPAGILVVAEEARDPEPKNYLAVIDPTTGRESILDEGHDFYSSQTLSPDGRQLAWITWDHPNMPWDGTYLWCADFDGVRLSNKNCIAGGDGESIFQPRWSPQGTLYFMSDSSGWWNLHTARGNVFPYEADFGKPLWVLGMSTWGFTGEAEQIFCTFSEGGRGRLALLDLATKQLERIETPHTEFAQIAMGKGFALFLAGSPTESRRVARLDLKTRVLSYLTTPAALPIDPANFSIPESITFPTTDDAVAHGFFYPPKNARFKGPEGTLPPLIVMSHGGPTAATDSNFNIRIQYWTSRGFAVFDVNYRGSSGYGRAYRDALKGKWGIYDVDDCREGALYLGVIGKVDAKRMVIRGGSAGGFTTLAALVGSEAFAAGASYYGVADLHLLVRDTHKFESRYLESLIGPYKTARHLYDERSPLYQVDKINAPVIFFQGGMDKIVPPNQAEVMFNALKERGIDTEMILYPEEDHGFRCSQNVADSLDKELKFYLKIFTEG